jgi:uncharacterized Ntn-hydrolase superfamily protein
MTYSIVARDTASGELGIAVQSRFFAAGRIVPFIEPGVGAIATQAFTNPRYGSEGLRLLGEGMAPEDALDRLRREDPNSALRQVAILDARGRMAVHTGARCVAAAGHAIGDSCTAQANMMRRDTVWSAMVRAFEEAAGALAERLLAALEAAEREGGDLRGAQAAALIVVSDRRRNIDLRVDDHPDPLGEIRRLLAYTRAHSTAEAALAKLTAGNAADALIDLKACCEAYPDEPEFLTRYGFALLAAGQVDAARVTLTRACTINPGWGELVLRLADAGVVPMSRDTLAPLVAGVRSSGTGGNTSPA